MKILALLGACFSITLGLGALVKWRKELVREGKRRKWRKFYEDYTNATTDPRELDWSVIDEEEDIS